MTTKASPTIDRDHLLATTLNELVAANPNLLGVLSAYGLDLCCGGNRPLGEALQLHGFDPDDGAARVAAAIRDAGSHS